MRAVLQVTKKSSVLCEGAVVSQCGKGMCILLGLGDGDTKEIADKVIQKILKMRIFTDNQGKLNLSAVDVEADILVVSNFTLYANLSSRRPDFLKAMKFGPAKELYEYFMEKMQAEANLLATPGGKSAKIFPGVFGGDMIVEITGDGPVTILVDSEDL